MVIEFVEPTRKPTKQSHQQFGEFSCLVSCCYFVYLDGLLSYFVVCLLLFVCCCPLHCAKFLTTENWAANCCLMSKIGKQAHSEVHFKNGLKYE